MTKSQTLKYRPVSLNDIAVLEFLFERKCILNLMTEHIRNGTICKVNSFQTK